jgi:TonB family protein
MRSPIHLSTICLVGSLLTASWTQAQQEITNSQAIVSAKTIYFEDKSGVDAVGKRASAELGKWGRFQIVADRTKADLIIALSTDPEEERNLIVSGGQTASIDPQGHVQEDSVPTYNKLEPVHYAFLIVVDARTGEKLWSASQRWGGLLNGFDSVGERLVKELEKQTLAAEQRSRLKVIKRVNPAYPPEASKMQIEGTVVVRIVVDKNGMITSAKALSGPPELLQSSVQAVKQYQFEPPQNAPITTELEIRYGLEPKPCPPGRKGEHPQVTSGYQLPMKTGHPGDLKLLAEINLPPPPYPEEATAAGIEGVLELIITVAPSGDVIGARVTNPLDFVIDKSGLATVRTWKFKVSRGQQANFPIKFRYEMTCSSFDEK